VITITNTQRKHRTNTRRLKKAATAMLTELGYAGFDLGILICGATRMAAFNGQYRNKHKATDVLSFPYHENLTAGQAIVPATPDDANLGDIILCPLIIDKKRHEWGRSFDDHCVVLLAHAIAHLLGHDHETDADYAIMQQLENRLLDAVEDMACTIKSVDHS